MPLTLRARASPPRPVFSFSTSPPPTDDDGPAAHHPRPPGDFLPERDMHMYGAQPLEGVGSEPGRGIVRCPRCDRTVLEWAAGEHRRICSHILDGAPLTVKKTLKSDKRVRAGTEEGTKKRRASEVSPDSPDASPNKKRARVVLPEDLGSDDEIDPNAYKGLKKSEIKKLLKERERLKKRAAKEREKAAIAERKRQRATNPLDYDRQCGVINDKNLPCSRSLTCKTHTVGAKRAVQGRTRPYDELFIEWQRAHNPNFKEPQPKREKEAKTTTAAASGTTTVSAADRKAAAAKKRRAALGLGDEDGLRFDEDGHREMEELIRATRLAGERVRSASWQLGAPPGSTPKTVPRPLPSRVGAPPPVPGTPFPSVWRTTTYEQLNMGDLLTKALATRPLPPPQMLPPVRAASPSRLACTQSRTSLSLFPRRASPPSPRHSSSYFAVVIAPTFQPLYDARLACCTSALYAVLPACTTRMYTARPSTFNPFVGEEF